MGITRNDSVKENIFTTYSGTCLIATKYYNHVIKKVGFFDSIVQFKDQSIKLLTREKEHWDFGTTERYKRSLFKILNRYDDNKNPYPFLEKLFKGKSFSKELFKKDIMSYGKTNVKSTINLTNSDLLLDEGSIAFSDSFNSEKITVI